MKKLEYLNKIQSLSEKDDKITIKCSDGDGYADCKILLNGKEIGFIVTESDTIIDSFIEEKFRNNGYYKLAIFEYVRRYKKVISSFQSEEAGNAWNSIKKNVPKDMNLKSDFQKDENTWVHVLKLK